MFNQWEKNFEQWKADNADNPDWDYVQNHIDEMMALKGKMLKRREALKKQRMELLGQPYKEPDVEVGPEEKR